MFTNGKLKLLVGLLVGGAIVVATACGGDDEAAEPVSIRETVIVERTVVVTEKGDTIIETVIVTERGETVEVIVTATPILPATATPVPADKPAPPSKNPSGQLVWATTAEGSIGGGYNAGNLCCGADDERGRDPVQANPPGWTGDAALGRIVGA